MLAHRGRKSGNLYRTVLEVADRNRGVGESIVTAYDGTANGRVEMMKSIPMVGLRVRG